MVDLSADTHAARADRAREDEDAQVFPLNDLRRRLAAEDATPPVARYRETLEWGRTQLYTLFREGLSATALVHAHARFVDTVLAALWQRLLPTASHDLALVAVGGYGRRELLPHSDVDLLILAAPGATHTHRAALADFNALLWDIGLEAGLSTRTVAECASAAADITVMTNLLEARIVCGDVALVEALAQAIDPSRIWPVADYYRAKLDEQARRHHKYDDTAYRLEPNVKESPGGLRDVHTVGWVAKRQFGAESLAGLRDYGFLTHAEYHELIAGEDFLWRVRFALHMLAKRREDRLLFDYQVQIATLFGYEDPDRNRAVEQFMQLYYRTIKSLSCLNDLLLQSFDEAILKHNADAVPQPLNARFQLRGDTIEAARDNVFSTDPVALLEIFALMQAAPGINGIRAHTLRLMRHDLPRLDRSVRTSARARAVFIGLFRHGAGLTRALRRMNRYDVLGQYYPEFGRIVGLMQYDLFHTLTVDEHTLQLVRNLRRMAEPRFAHELPFQSELFKRVEHPELLYLAGFLHDLAKGSGGDHSAVGAENARRFCHDHGLAEADSELVAWLVRNHLLMSLTAQRKDTSDPEIITQFAALISNQQRLDALYLLTVADIRATNPTLWNAWKDSLLKELYHTTRRALQRGLDNPVGEAERATEQRQAVLTLVAHEGGDPAAVEALWPRFSNDYYTRHTPRELVWQLGAIATAQEADLPLILVDVLEGRGTSVFVYMRDRDHLFALTAAVLTQLGLSILDARITTSADGYTLDTWMVQDDDGPGAANPLRNAEIRTGLRKVLADPTQVSVPVNRRIPRQLRNFTTPPAITFRQDPAADCTSLEVTASDRPGLLAQIGRAIARRGLRIEAAKIATIGEKAEDVFFITNAHHQPVTDPMLLRNLKRSLMRALLTPDTPPVAR
ncbi:MAG: [protein-PII] uridylyltransferase [Nevskiaceae bacterium]|nr:MAG: [protein-PII] uridylyltransferase [Nevskiaceae bacterium]TBR71788.1 MAG: [protein-PII] uridylyltransferase [Nevskiaceae bacterium]